MDNLLLYLLKVSAGTSLFYLCYLLFFRKDTFYLRNRIFLIATLLLPVFIPALKIPVHSETVAAAGPFTSIEGLIDQVALTESTITASAAPLDYTRILVLLYFIVAGLLFLKGVISLISTFRIIKKGDLRSTGFPKVVVTDIKIPAFSFFPYAVIPAEEYDNKDSSDIIEHEFAHIRQGHTFDLLLSEVFIAFQWFNPFAWFIKRSVILNHEYLADHVSLHNNKGIREYQYRLLNLSPELKSVSLAHNFNSLIKNRIIMINRKPTRKYASLKNIIVLPVAFFVIYAFATPDYRYSDASAGDNTISLIQPPVILQKEIKGIITKEDGSPLNGVHIITTGTEGNISSVYSGSDGRFKIDLANDEPYLLLSAAGYKSQSVKADNKKEMAIRMIKDPGAEKPSNDSESQPKPMRDDVFVVVEKMPMYPGGDAELLKYISDNSKYPEAAKADKAEGKVIVRFMVSTLGNAEEVSVLKGVHPLLDAEAVRVVSTLTGFEPGMQSGKLVNVWYMVPINFVMPKTETDQEQPVSIRSENGKKPLIVVDNMITDFDANNIGIDRKNIESVTVLKDKAATDKYGEKAKEGAIEIITKKEGNK